MLGRHLHKPPYCTDRERCGQREPDKASQGAFNVEIAPRQDEFRELSGLECDKVDARTPEQLAQAQANLKAQQQAQKQAATRAKK